MDKKFLIKITIGICIFVILTLYIIIFQAIEKRYRYNNGLDCFKNKNWNCVIKNYQKLNYKDSNEKFLIALYEYSIQNAETYLQNKNNKAALELYKNALKIQPNNKEIKIKTENLELILKEEKKQEEIKIKKKEEQAKINAIKAKISDLAIYPIPTKFGEGYDETIKKYGISTIKRINNLTPKVAEYVAQNPKCTRVMAVGVADDRSTRNSLTFFVDCGDIEHIRDIQRYYVNEKDLKTKSIPKSIKEQADSIDNSQYLMMCEAEIKARLSFPSTYKSNILTSSVYKAPMNTVITIPFKTKNAFNLELKYKGNCYYNGGTLTDININEE